ncbi:hypothetical protein GOP47_0004219 [Adiantum capillus-veneris]|uniref:Ataxin-2 C-terminal domain-containing protein n=1 Tax=Adiantum capillus-veneris TaxID=13818 RepID=A0A9D4V896_ADICA|nr:hypothetical protein GOP47_0004219 [Adiantum capillus-veneris]
MAVKSRPFSYLNPNAPLFVPAAFLEAEDFSPEWWRLVHTCPAFRDYWLRDRYGCSDEEELTAQDIEELDSVDDLMDLHADLVDLELAEEALQFASENDSAFSTDLYDSDSLIVLVDDLKFLDMQ